MHFWFNDIDTTGPGVLAAGITQQIVHCNCTGDIPVENTLWDLLKRLIQNSIRCHEMSDITNQQHASTGQHQLITSGLLIGSIRIQGSG